MKLSTAALAAVLFSCAAFAPAATPDLASCDSWYPAASCNYEVSNRPSSYPISYVVIHKVQGTASSAASWFQNCAAGASTHYSFNNSTGYCYQSVYEKDIAWHGANYWYAQRAIGIEHGGYDNSNDTAQVCYDESALETKSCILYYSVTHDRSHILGHQELPGCSMPGYGGQTCSGDPGPYWNWSYYMSKCNPGSSTPAWDAQYNNQSYPALMAPGATATMWLEYKNMGTQTWNPGTGTPTRLATSNPRGSTGYLYVASNWPNFDRASDVDYSTGPGAIGRFTFLGKAPTTPGYYVSSWELVTDGVSWFEGGGDNAWFGTQVAYQGNNVLIQAEDFTGARNGTGQSQNAVDFYDTDATNHGGQYRNGGCNIRACVDGGYQVGWTATGEWMRYYWNCTSTGNYRFKVRYANGSGATKQVNLQLFGANVAQVGLPNTGSYDAFADATATVNFSSTGMKELKLYNANGGADYTWFALDKL